jgi:hypothetical protein
MALQCRAPQANLRLPHLRRAPPAPRVSLHPIFAHLCAPRVQRGGTLTPLELRPPCVVGSASPGVTGMVGPLPPYAPDRALLGTTALLDPPVPTHYLAPLASTVCMVQGPARCARWEPSGTRRVWRRRRVQATVPQDTHVPRGPGTALHSFVLKGFSLFMLQARARHARRAGTAPSLP